jgi:translation elongation factor EF-G
LSQRTLNLGILAHVDAGKTTLTERLLYAAGVIDEIGSVDADRFADARAAARDHDQVRGLGATTSRCGDLATLQTLLPAARTQELQRQLPGLTSGEGVAETSFGGYRPVTGRRRPGRM